MTDACKGYFPHKFNHPDHQNYVGPFPALDYYMPETMSPEGKQALETWHQDQRDQVFDFKKELVKYCQSDVRLLKQGCLTFKRLFETLTGFNPFDHITIASACNRDLRMNRMIPNSIASEPVRGWRNRINQSERVALEWLTWCGQEVQRREQCPAKFASPQLASWMGTATTSRISVISNFKGVLPMDGERVIANRHAPHCTPLSIGPCKMSTRLPNKRSNVSKSSGTRSSKCGNVNGLGSKTPPRMSRTFVAQLQFTTVLNLRHAFCGGRTNAVKMYYRCHHPLKRTHSYIDVSSLIPLGQQKPVSTRM